MRSHVSLDFVAMWARFVVIAPFVVAPSSNMTMKVVVRTLIAESTRPCFGDVLEIFQELRLR